MRSDKPSATAQIIAMSRALHLLRQGPPHVFEDPLAWPLVGPDAEILAALSGAYPREALDPLRANFLYRARVTEDLLLEWAKRGLCQYVVLGAGLESFAWRRRDLLESGAVSVFEVDEPATQAWKRARLAELQVPDPPGLRFVPIDFASGDLSGQLRAAGLKPELPTVWNWLGVTMYLAVEAVEATARQVASLGGPSILCVSYMLDETSCTEDQRQSLRFVADQVAARGEPLVSLFSPLEVEAVLVRCGFGRVEHVAPDGDRMSALFQHHPASLRPNGVERVAVAIAD